ncbi:hypothetical protein [Rhizobium sp. SGZ-381]|uniref:hypothetical protein n=1 Tax=Rhizobium sp. SGZ-381 TaxID=3342800 RepID=UPI00366A7AF1
MSQVPPARLLADCGGLIEKLGISLPSAFFGGESFDRWSRPLAPIGNLIAALPAGIALFLVVDRQRLAEAERWLATLPLAVSVTLVPLDMPEGARQSPWMQDLLHVRDLAGNHLSGGEILSRPGTAVGPALARSLGWEAVSVTVELDGGNQLVGENFRIVGAASLERNGLSSPPPESAAPADLGLLETLDDRPVHLFGYRAAGGTRLHQPGFHVDQFVSVTGLSRNARPLLLVAEPRLEGGGESRLVEQARSQLDASAVSLERQGFAVIRNPVPFAVTPDSGKRLARLYNNVLLENVVRKGREKPLVWLPHFGDVEALSAYDEANRHLWQDLGFEVIGVSGWSHLASRNGALRCSAKVLQRLKTGSSSSLPDGATAV